MGLEDAPVCRGKFGGGRPLGRAQGGVGHLALHAPPLLLLLLLRRCVGDAGPDGVRNPYCGQPWLGPHGVGATFGREE